MKKVYKKPEISRLGNVMDLTKGNDGFGLQDFFRAILRGDLEEGDHLFGRDDDYSWCNTSG